MGDRTKIEWTDATWNPVRGCSRKSEGCRHCYAELIAARFSDPGEPYHGFAERVTGADGSYAARWTGRVELVEAKLRDPLRWRIPRRIFVNSTSDLFHEALPDEAIVRVFAVMALARQHTFQVLTKRADRMRALLASTAFRDEVLMAEIVGHPSGKTGCWLDFTDALLPWPLPNVWLGVSTEDQAAADERIPELLATDAAVRFISAEPLIGPLDLFSIFDRSNGSAGHPVRRLGQPLLDWVITGGESGPGARPPHPAWFRNLRDQCHAAGVPFFFKQWGEWAPGGFSLPSETQEDLELRGRLNDWGMLRVGKAIAGRMLDGRTHNASPNATPVLL